MNLNLQDIARAIGAARPRPGTRAVTGWSVDTRARWRAGDVYFALRGPNHDGHDYVGARPSKRARPAAVVRTALRAAPLELVVADTLARASQARRMGAEAMGRDRGRA